MDLNELIESMEEGGFKVWCPGTDELIDIKEYLANYLLHELIATF